MKKILLKQLSSAQWKVQRAPLPRYSVHARTRVLKNAVFYLPKRVIKFLSKRKAVSYLYGQGVHKHPAVWVVAMIIALGAGFWAINVYQPTLADTDTQTVRPNGSAGINNFATTNGTTNSSCTGHCDYVDEADDTTFLSTGTGMDGTTAEEEFDMADITVPGGGTLNSITQVQVTVRAGINTLGDTADGLNVRIFIDGAYNGTTNSVTLTTTTTDHTFTWSGLSATTASDLRVEVIRVVNGSGSPNSRDDDIEIFEVKADVTLNYTSTSSLPHSISLEGYVFTNDNTMVSAGSEFTTGKTLNEVRKGERIGLRAHVTNEGGPLSADTEFGLFYDRNDGIWSKVQAQSTSLSTSGNCDSDTNFTCTTIDSAITSSLTPNTSLAITPEGRVWIAYRNSNEDLMVAMYVASGGNCSDSAWECHTVDASSNMSQPALTINSAGNAWIVYRDYTNTVIKVATFVGSGGNCSSSAWDCTTLDSSSNSWRDPAITTDESGTPWIAYHNNQTDGLEIATLVGSGGDCTDTAWDCTTLDSVGDQPSIAFDTQNRAWVSYVSTGSLIVAVNVGGTGGNCNDTAWSCTEVDSSSFVGTDSSLAFDSSGQAWVSYKDGTNSTLKIARNVGSGGNCTSSSWSCEVIDSSANTTGSSLAFDPSGQAWVSYGHDTSLSLKHARFTGSGLENSCTSGSSDWDCSTIVSSNAGWQSSIAFDYSGNAWISHIDSTNSQLELVKSNRRGEILFSPSTSNNSGTSISTSYVDMTNSEDTVNRDDGDCLQAGGSWNNGIMFTGEHGSNISLSEGGTTPQCTEMSWVIDTSQAIPGTTYRFVIATNDSFSADKSPWRGPVGVATDGYPTLTIAGDEQSVYRYSKDVLGAFESTCSGDSNWGCTTVDVTDAVGDYNSITIDHEGAPWIVYRDATNLDTKAAHYVGSGGNCDTTGAGSDMWDCYDIDVTNASGDYTSIAIDKSGNPWVAFRSGGNLAVANYVGTGGSCSTFGGGSTAWDCTEIYTTGSSGHHNSIAFDPAGNAWISFRYSDSADLMVAKHVGTGGNCDTVGAGSDAWQCTTVDATDDVGTYTSLAFNENGMPWISYFDETNLNLEVARYVGSGGNCDTVGAGSDAWECLTVDGTGNVGQFSSLSFDSNGDPWISYFDNTNFSLKVARYTGTGSETSCVGGSSDWDCVTVEDSAGVEGRYSSIGFDANGDAWIAYWDGTNLDMQAARYVGSGGNCDNTGGSDAWQCMVVDSTSDVGEYTSIAFDHSGSPWVSYYDNAANDNLKVAKMKLPDAVFSANMSNVPGVRNAGSGDLRYHLSAGLAPYTDPYGTCASPSSGINGYCGVYHPDGQIDSVTALAYERPVYGFSTRFSSNSILPTASLHFTTDVSPSTNNVVLQVYRFGTTNAWETLSTYSTAGCSTENCIIRTLPSGTASEYFETDGSEYWVHYRVYQVESTSSEITFGVDSFTAEVPPKQLRGGRVFRELTSDPLGW